MAELTQNTKQLLSVTRDDMSKGRPPAALRGTRSGGNAFALKCFAKAEIVFSRWSQTAGSADRFARLLWATCSAQRVQGQAMATLNQHASDSAGNSRTRSYRA